MSKTLSVPTVARELEAIFNTKFLNNNKDMAHLNTSVQQALDFYILADQREQAFLKNTIQRLRDRGEKKVVMVIGGYHTARQVLHQPQPQRFVYCQEYGRIGKTNRR